MEQDPLEKLPALALSVENDFTWVHMQVQALDKEIRPLFERLTNNEVILREQGEKLRYLENERERLNNENQYLHLALSTTEDCLNKTLNNQEEREQLRRRIQELEAEIETQKEQSKQLELRHIRDHQALENQFRKQEQANTAMMESERHQSQEQIRVLQKDLERLRKERETAQTQKADLQKKLSSKDSEMKEMREKYDALQQEFTDSTMRLKHQLDEATLKQASKPRKRQQLVKPMTANANKSMTGSKQQTKQLVESVDPITATTHNMSSDFDFN